MDIAGKRNFSGVIMAGLLLLLVILIFIPVGIFIVNDNSGPDKSRNSTAGELFIARKAINDGYLAASSPEIIKGLFKNGPNMSGYNFDKTYNYGPEGADTEYEIRISTQPGKNIVIESKVRGGKGGWYGLAYYYGLSSIIGPLWGEDVDLTSTIKVHWGPVYASRRISAGWNVFPRKFSRGDVINRDSNGIDSPNSDMFEWWSYTYIPAYPAIDFFKIMRTAKRQGGYYKEMNIVLSDVVDSKPRYRYFEHNLKLKGGIFLNGITVVKGSLEIDAQGAGNMRVDVPYKAWREYVLIDTAAKHEYPGDAGYKINSGNYEFNQKNPLSFCGFLYVEGDLKVSGSNNMYGSCVLKGEIFDGGEFAVYYNRELEIPVLAEVLAPYDDMEFNP